MKHIALIFALLLAGCKTAERAQSQLPAVVLNNADSVRVETVTETVYVPVEVFVDLPRQSVRTVTAADSSHVETDLAESEAWINPDGTLGHSIANKPGKLSAQTFAPHTSTQTDREAVRAREVPVPDPYPVYVERKLTKAEQFKLAAFWYLVSFALVSIVYIIRKPLWIVFRKLLRV